jgi:hypothetical protein
MPGVVRRLNKSKFPGGGGIAEDLGVVHRVDAVQATRPHASTGVAATFRQSRGSGGEDEGCDESNLGLGRHIDSPWLVCCLSN